MTLKGKTVLITGASRGIGAATAMEAAVQGANLIINYHQDQDAAESVKHEVEREHGVRATTIQADVSDPSAAKKLITKSVDKLSTIDVLINNAGIHYGERTNLDEADLKDWHRMVDVNLTGIINTCYYTIPQMKKTGGVIINIASGAGKTGYPGLAVYCATKFAVLGLTESLGKELAPQDIRVYAVCPGYTATDMTGGKGMPPQKVARRIIQTAQETLGLNAGEETEIYS